MSVNAVNKVNLSCGLHLVCHPYGNLKMNVSIGICKFFSSGQGDVIRPKTLKVTRKGTEATNCHSLTHPIGSNLLFDFKGNRMEAGFRIVDDNSKKISVQKTGEGVKYF
jgi:hypothetical protein